MTVIPFESRFEQAMASVAAAARRNTHIIVAKHKPTGEVLSWHARPRAEAIEYRDARRATLGDAWTVRIVRVRRRWGR